jgi:hypothetical protein
MTPTSSRVKAFRLQKTYVTLVIPETAVNPPPTHAGTFPQPPTHGHPEPARRATGDPLFSGLRLTFLDPSDQLFLMSSCLPVLFRAWQRLAALTFDHL